MPFKLSTLISPRANRWSSRSPTSSRNQCKLYFPPGGHTHDRHTIPPDRLHISLSDPVLVAAEERLSSTPDRSKLAIVKESSARNGTNPGSALSQFGKGGVFLSRRSGDDNIDPLVGENVDLIMETSTRGTSQRHSWKTGFRRAATHVSSSLDSSDESCDIVEVMSMSVIDVSPDRLENRYSLRKYFAPLCLTRDLSRNGPDLAPLASEMFKEELYIRGYLKRPASRPANAIPRASRTTFTLMSRFPKVLGRRQGRKVAETLRAEQVRQIFS